MKENPASNATVASVALINLGPRNFDDLGPLADFCQGKAAELFGCIPHGFCALGHQLFPHTRLLEYFDNLGIDPVDDVGWRPRRGIKPRPSRGLEALDTRLIHGGHVGQL